MKEPTIISVGGGKGGVGKSVITANLAAKLSQKNFRVGLIDGDLRGANLHLCVGVRRPKFGLQDFISGKAKSLAEIAMPTIIPNTWLISGASDIINLANPKFAQKQKLISHLRKMEADYILIDLGAGTDFQVSDFFSAFTHGIVVVDSLPTSIENAYGFLKNGIIRGLVRLFPGNKAIQAAIMRYSDPASDQGTPTITDMVSLVERSYPSEVQIMKTWLHAKKTFLIQNMVKEQSDIDVGQRFRELVKRYLGIDILYIGYIEYSLDIRKSVRALTPLVLIDAHSAVARCFDAIANNLCELTKR
jgi:flagellar biosynthesis protein FlhG